MGDYEETVPDRTGKCVVCGTETHDRTVTINRGTGKVAYRTWRCSDFEPCRDRRAATKKRNRKPPAKKPCRECGGFLWHEDNCPHNNKEKSEMTASLETSK